MDNIDLYEFVSEVDHLLSQRRSEPEPPYWFYNNADLVDAPDEAERVCWDCLHKIMPEAQSGEHFGGGYCMEEDGCETCVKCGKLLQYSLTQYGLESELHHFTENEWDWQDADTCYELASVIDGITTDDERNTLLKAIKQGHNPPSELAGLVQKYRIESLTA